MKAVIFHKYGDPEVLEHTDVVTPRAKAGEVLIKIKAASVNPVDWKIRKGRLKIITGRKFPKYMGIEMAGIIESVGEGVTKFKPGQRVFAGIGYRGGAYAQFAAVPQENVVVLPDNISFDKACTFAVAGVTSLQALRDHGKLEEGMHVLINGASGGVGTYAVQIAKILGAKVTAVCSTKNVRLVKSLGADTVIDYTKKDFAASTNEYDIIIDAAGNKSFRKVKSSLRKHGILIKLNYSAENYFAKLWTRFFSSKKVKLILLKNEQEDVKWVRDHIAIGKIRVVIDRKFPLSEARKAHEYSETERSRGKIILTVD